MNTIAPNKIPVNIHLPVFQLFLSATTFGIFHHELWLNEAQHPERPVYYVNTGHTGSYCIWKRSYFNHNRRMVVAAINDLDFAVRSNKFLLVTPVKANKNKVGREDQCSLYELDSFTGGIIHADYFLYSVTRNVNVASSQTSDTRE